MSYPQPHRNGFARSAQIPDTAKNSCSNEKSKLKLFSPRFEADDDPLGAASRGCSQFCLVSIM